MACALEDATTLFDSLERHRWDATALPEALADYSRARVPEGNAITDLNFAANCRTVPGVGLLFFLSQLVEKILFRRPTLFDELKNPVVTFQALLKR